MLCLRGACMKALVGGSGRFLYQDLARSAPAAAGPCMTILWASLKSPGMKILSRSFTSPCEKLLWRTWWNAVRAFAWSCTGPWETLLKRSWWNPLGVLTWSGTGPCEKILWRSCWNPPQKVLAFRYWRFPALVFVWKFFWDAHRKFLYEDLVSSYI